MAGLSPKLPLHYSGPEGDYQLTKTYVEAIKQNLKNLILTAPGERIMNPHFGVGLRNYLFEQLMPSTKEEIAARISNQIKSYLPFVNIQNIEFLNSDEQGTTVDNSIHIRLKYIITPLAKTDLLEI